MAWTFTGNSAVASGTSIASLDVVLNGTRAGNFIAVYTGTIQTFSDTPGINVSDNVNGSYSLSKFQTSGGDQVFSSLHYFAAGAGGNLTITTDPQGPHDSSIIRVVAAEFAGGHRTSPPSGAASGNFGFSTPPSTGSATPADNDVLLLAGTLVDNIADPISPDNGFSTIADDDVDICFSFAYKIITGPPTAINESWTVSSNSTFAAILAAFKPAPFVSGATAGTFFNASKGYGWY